MKRVCKIAAALWAGPFVTWATAAQSLPPRYDHIVIVFEENHSQTGIIGSADAPYINSLATGGASFTNMHALTHPSQPNYLQLFSGSAQGVIDDTVPINPSGQPTTTDPFVTANLGAELRQAGFSFGGYAQTLPSVGAQDAISGDYARKHAPWTNWQNNAWVDDAHPPTLSLANTLPASVNMPFTSFPSSDSFASLPTVSFVVPDLQNDMHNGTVPQADTWLATNIDPYYQWAKTHNSLLIVTWDEDDSKVGGNNTIPTIFAGAGVKAGGVVAQPYTIHNLLRTVEDMYALPYAGTSANVRPVVGPFVSDPAVTRITFRQGVSGYTGTKDTQIREAAPTKSYGTSTTLISDADDDDVTAGNQRAHTLIRFDNIIAGAGGLIPTDATILSAKLTLYTTNATTTPVELHRMITGWTTTSTWNSVGGGIAADGVQAAVSSDFTGTPSIIGNTVYFDVSDTLQLWVDRKAPNNGWVLLPTSTHGLVVGSSEATNAAQRPSLDVSYALYPRFSATGGSWNTAANWAHGLPDNAGAVAGLLTKPAASTLTLDGSKTVGTLILDSPNAYTLNAGTGGTLSFADNGNVATLQVKQGQHTLGVPLSFIGPGSVDVAANAKATATAGVSVAAGATLNKINAGAIQINGGLSLSSGAAANIVAGELLADRINGTGSLAIRAGATARLTQTSGPASIVTSLSIDGSTGAWTGALDIGRSALVVNYTGASPLAAVSDQIKSAWGANWTGPGIGSSAAAADASACVAVSEASTLLGLSSGQSGTFMGQSVDSTSLLVRYTKAGDATLDGKVDFADLVKVAQDYGATTGVGGWSEGDFNYDGMVNFSDLVKIAQNYGAATPGDAIPGAPADFSAEVAAAFASVPEPSLMFLLGLVPVFIRRRGIGFAPS
jgi:hypothetical protein